jgi:hypothetical protein
VPERVESGPRHASFLARRVAVGIVPVPALTYQEPIIDLASVQGWRTLDGFKETGRLVIPH